ncbi:MAG: NAD(P)-binding domain-containing protein [Sumerlaeia bacterium]
MSFPNPIAKTAHWLHTRWPAGTVEKLPLVNDDGTCQIPGVYIVGDLSGIPLLKFSLHTGSRAVKQIASDPKFQKQRKDDGSGSGVRDLVIIGGGVAGMAAAVEARRQALDFELLEAAQPFNTIANFPKRKPIYTYPTDMTPEGDLQVSAEVKEELLEELKGQIEKAGITSRAAVAEKIARSGSHLEVHLAKEAPIKARRVIIAIGRSGNYRRLGVPGQDLDKVTHRLYDPNDHTGQDCLVVGGGDSALETAIALVKAGANVTLSYRRKDFGRAKPDNVEMIERLARGGDCAKMSVENPEGDRETTASGDWLHTDGRSAGRFRLMMGSNLKEVRESDVELEDADGQAVTLPNDIVFAMIGREAPLDFFRKSGIPIIGEGTPWGWAMFAGFLAFCVWMYLWKGGSWVGGTTGAFPGNVPNLIASLGDRWAAQVNDRSTLIGTVAVSMQSRSFYYSFLYCLAVVIFGIRRIRRRKTPYVKLQTIVLMAIQVIPLFVLPEVLLPWLGYNGAFDAGIGRTIADNLFEPYISAQALAAHDWPAGYHPRAYWRAYGLILAWPLMIYNVFTDAPMLWWLVISSVQTFVIIPAGIFFYGKGFYCGWICSCGALAETLGDAHRQKMPHGPFWNRLNMVGQLILWLAVAFLILRIVGWVFPGSAADKAFKVLVDGKTADGATNPISYKYLVDIFLAGIIGVGFYFKYSGRVWCRFFCPLAALMHVFTRFSRFRIFADKKKCISCNVCTSVCHQGIDIMSFANKGLPMEDPECVRCSACVQSCPTGVLAFGRTGRDGSGEYHDQVPASLVRMAEARQKQQA